MNEHLGDNTLGVVTAPGTVCIKRVLPGPVERVWAYLTESDKRRKWLARGPISSFVGGDVELTFHHSELSQDPVPEEYKKYEGHTNKGKVTRYDPPHVLSYTWPDGPNEPSEATFELAALGNGYATDDYTYTPCKQKFHGQRSGWLARPSRGADCPYGRAAGQGFLGEPQSY